MEIIHIKDVSKKFIIDINPLTLFNLCKRIIKPQKHYREFWALKNINISIQRGDRVAIIGNNGSGKTTLLKIISGLYRTTSGEFRVHGSCAAFLYMGLGTERNLTALENIYLFGAILGLNRKEIRKILDDIISFAELNEFIHCPLRDFSSGMIQRLAFAIAKQVRSEILILDEMLSTGDIGFREKCYEVLDNFALQSKTIIMTSHEIEMVRNFCNKCLWLEKGRQMAFGPSESVINAYLRFNHKNQSPAGS